MSAPKGNKFALGLTNSGRPPIYNNPDDLYARIIEYFDFIQGEYDEENDTYLRPPEPLTITGLCLYLGFSSKNTLYDYAKKQEFSDSIKRALMFVEQHYEEMLLSKASTGAIFALKNMGWIDKQEVDQKTKHVFDSDPFKKIRENIGLNGTDNEAETSS